MSTLDVVIATDLRLMDDEAISLARDVRRLCAIGHTVGLLHMPTKSGPDTQTYAPHYRALLARRVAQLVLPPDSVQARLVIVSAPDSATQPSPTEASVSAKQVLVTADTAPRRRLKVRYDVDTVSEHLTSLFGAAPTWAPYDATVRQALARHSPDVKVTSYDWGEATDKRAARIAKLLGTSVPRKRRTSHRSTEDVPLPERTHGVLIIDITGDDRPDVLLPAVRRETTDPNRPRVVATSAHQAAEHAGDLAVETLPRLLSTYDDERRRAYISTRIAGLVRSHQPEDVVILDDFSTGVDVRSICSGYTTKVWLVQPEGPVDLPAVNDTLGKRVESALPRGWVVSPVTNEEDDDEADADDGSAADGPTQTTKSLINTLTTRLRRGARMTVQTGRRIARRLRPPHPVPMPTALIVAPDVHADPETAVRTIVSRQRETNAFQPAILAPPDWEPVATEHGLPIETLIPLATWTSIYGEGWQEYVRQRVRDTRDVFGASTVVFTDNIAADVNAALDAIEGSAAAIAS